MHILIIPSWYPPQGGDFFRIQAEKISAHNQFVGVIYLEEYSIKVFLKPHILKQLFRFKICQENSLHVVRYSWIRFPQFEWLNLQIRNMLYKRIYRVYKKNFGHPDILHAHSALWGGYFCSSLKKKYGIPYVITEHRGRFNIKNQLPKKHIRWWFRAYLAKALVDSGKTICVTKYQIPFFLKQSSKLNEKRFVEIPNLFETNFAEQKLIEKSPNRPFTLLNIAIFSGYKNHKLLIRSIEQLVNLGHTDIRVLLAGDGKLRFEYEKLVREKKLTNYIQFLGYCDQQKLIESFNQSDYMILSSLAEGQPVSILESFAMGTPVIVPDIITDRIVNEQSGYTYKTGDLSDFVEKILLAKKSVTKFNKKLLRVHALKNFSADAIIPEILGVYKEVLSK